FAGKTRVELVVRRPDTPGQKLLLSAHVHTAQQLTPGGLSARYEFDVEALHGSVRTLAFFCDPPLQPYKVTLGGAETRAGEGRRGGGGQLLTLTLREPALGALPPLRIYCEAVLPRDKKEVAWASPGVRLRGAQPRGEVLRLSVPPDVRLEKWKAN